MPVERANDGAADSRELTPKQVAFAVAYLETGSPTAAYRIAYNTANMASPTIWSRANELMHNGKVTVRIAELQKAAADIAIVGVLTLAAQAQRVYDQAIREHPVFDREGAPTGEYVFNAAGAMRALEFLRVLFNVGGDGLKPGERHESITIVRRTRNLDE